MRTRRLYKAERFWRRRQPPTTPNLPRREPNSLHRGITAKDRVLSVPLGLFADEEIAEDERIHLRAKEAVEGFFRAADDGLVVVEGGIEDHGDAGKVAKRGDQRVIAGIGCACYRL